MAWYDVFDTLMAERLPLVQVLREEPMERHTTFRIGGPARRLAAPASITEMTDLLSLAEAEGWPWLVAGNGSNLLVADEGLDCLVILTTALDFLALEGKSTLVAGAGTRLAKAAVFAMEHSLAGLAFAHGIPGTVGGAVFMNAGAYGGEMAQVISRVTAWFPGEGVQELTELDFGYRHSRFEEGGVILSATLALHRGERGAIGREMAALIARRQASQPLDRPSAGSAFKRPATGYAAALIDQCGLKGLTIGGAQVSEKHAGFIVNRGGATCADVTALLAEVRRRVLAETGIDLEPEIRIVR